MSAPLFPGGTAVSGLSVYDGGFDHVHPGGGTPHVHTVSTEGYVVVAGSGAVTTLTAEGEASHDLEKGSVLWFSPGTVHRLSNRDDLQIVTIMQNSGLPEAGDAVMTFPHEVLQDADAYARAAGLPNGDPDVISAAVDRRRELALEGYAELLESVSCNGVDALFQFYALAAALVRPKVELWNDLWLTTVGEDVKQTQARLKALGSGDPSHLFDARVVEADPRPAPLAYGMCGRLQQWDAPER